MQKIQGKPLLDKSSETYTFDFSAM